MKTESQAALLCLLFCLAWHFVACSSNSTTTSGGATGSQTTGSQTTGSQTAGSTTTGTSSQTTGSTGAGTGSATAGSAGSTGATAGSGATTGAASGAATGAASGASTGTGSGASSGGGSGVGTGSSTGMGGTGASGSSSGAVTCGPPTVATGLISNFAAGNVSNQLVGGSDTWYSVPAPMVTAGVAHFAVPATAANMDPAISTVIAAKGGVVGCVDLTAKYTSISFKIGSPTNTSLLFEITSLETAKAQDGSGFRKSFALSSTIAPVTLMLSDLLPPPSAVGLTPQMYPA